MIIPMVALAFITKKDTSLTPLAADLWQALGWQSAVTVVLLGSSSIGSMGAQRCPAAVSATLNLGARMVCAYGAELLFFNSSVSWLSVSGACLMILSCVVMTVTRSKKEEQKDLAAQAAGAQPSSVVSNASTEETDGSMRSSDDGSSQVDSDTESLASFIFREFATAEPHPEARMRFRGTAANLPLPAANGGPVAQIVGAVELSSGEA